MGVRWLLLALGFIFGGVNASGSCREANLCCKGRDSSCVGINSGVALNSVQDAYHETKPCYCDHACLKVGDCCPDFQEVCGVTDCEVSSWGPWTDCSVECGTGVMTRERKVTLLPTNGGKFCPELAQKRSCYGTHCDQKAHIKASQEPAMILPATYSTIRQLNATEDIRSNLRLRYRKDPVEAISKED